jgi:hypothetical protein
LQQVPGHAAAEAESDHSDLRVRRSLFELIDTGFEVGKQLLGWGVCQRGRCCRWIFQLCRTTLGGEQVYA